jgi:hypothetical protein
MYASQQLVSSGKRRLDPICICMSKLSREGTAYEHVRESKNLVRTDAIYSGFAVELKAFMPSAHI